jgi:hypothetical protein
MQARIDMCKHALRTRGRRGTWAELSSTYYEACELLRCSFLKVIQLYLGVCTTLSVLLRRSVFEATHRHLESSAGA